LPEGLLGDGASLGSLGEDEAVVTGRSCGHLAQFEVVALFTGRSRGLGDEMDV
jgi:hypothetical protein